MIPDTGGTSIPTGLPETTATSPAQAGGIESTESPEELGEGYLESQTMAPLSGILGAKVFDLDGEEIGLISDLAVDTVTGIVSYVILESSNSSPDMQDDLVAFPWTALAAEGLVQPAGEQGTGSEPMTFVFNLDRALLEQAPGLSHDMLEDEPAQWSEDLYLYWAGVDEQIKEEDEKLLMDQSSDEIFSLITRLDNLEVVNGETNSQLDIQDIMIDLSTGKMVFFALDAGNLVEGETGLILVPYDYLQYGALSSGSVGYGFNLDEETLDDMPRLEQ